MIIIVTFFPLFRWGQETKENTFWKRWNTLRWCSDCKMEWDDSFLCKTTLLLDKLKSMTACETTLQAQRLMCLCVSWWKETWFLFCKLAGLPFMSQSHWLYVAPDFYYSVWTFLEGYCGTVSPKEIHSNITKSINWFNEVLPFQVAVEYVLLGC